MKKIFLLSYIFSFSLISAQQPSVIPKKDFENKFRYYSLQKQKFTLPDSLRMFINQGSQAKLKFVLPDSTKVYSLPQDNMICLVPEMKQFNMPNATSPYISFIIPNELKNELRHQPGRIPNAVIPYNIIPQRRDNTER